MSSADLPVHIPEPDLQFFLSMRGRLLRVVFREGSEELTLTNFLYGIHRGQVIFGDAEDSIPIRSVLEVYNIADKLIAKRDV